MNERVCLITGGTSGVGRAIAFGLARLGATIVLLVRNIEKGDRVVSEIRQETGNDHVNFLAGDLSRFLSILQFSDVFLSKYKDLHVLSNNAAVLPMNKEWTADGFEKIFGVNYLGHFLLTHLLIDCLKKSAPSRVLMVAGDPFILRRARLNLNDLNLEKQFNPLRATIRAAFAKALFAYELSMRLKGNGVMVNAFHPGFVRTGLTRNLPQPVRLLAGLSRFIFSDTCKPGIHLASSNEVDGISGRLFVGMKPVDFFSKSQYDVLSHMLWLKSLELTGLNE